MSAFAVQFLGSLIAVALLVALAAWAKIARPTAPLDEAAARRLFADEFPDAHVGAVWTAPDGRSAVTRSGDWALILVALGDGWVAREAPWSALDRARPAGEGAWWLPLDDVAAPRLRVTAERWPPALEPAA